MAVPPPLPDKTALRTGLRAARRRFLSNVDRDAADGAIRDRLRALAASGGPLAGYVALRDEPDVMPLLHEFARTGRGIALPHVGADGAMTFAAWRPGMALVRGPFGIAQPGAPGDIVPAILLVPLVGFDRQGARLGQGAGHYDRWCAAHPHARRIGIAWSVQEVASLPVDAWDVPLHGVVTEQDWIET